MPIERAVFANSSWTVFWTAPGQRPTSSNLIAEFAGTQTSPASPVDFDASGSNGPIVTYAWDFGDSTLVTKTTGPTVSHSYAKPGTYLVILTVSDGSGNAAQASRSVAVTVDVLPVAKFDLELTDMMVAVDATDSSDRDGQIVSYAWDFGDGATASGVIANHTYDFSGNYEITLIVTDNQGMVAMSTQSIEAAGAPDAEYNFTASGLVAHFDASPSTDFDPIVSYTWSWGYAGSTDTVLKTSLATHTFPRDGTFPVTLTIQDNLGRTEFVTHDVAVAKIVVPEPPLVRFTHTQTNLKVNVNASKTTDVDSWITNYAWDFGDGYTGSGVTTSHTYLDGGTYKIKLTATDNLNMHASTTHSVTVSLPMSRPPEPSSYVDIIIDTGNRFSMSKRDCEIALMVALTESSMLMYANKNIPESLKYPHDAIGSDHDSLGLFQQRASWGSVKQRMDATYSAGAFYTALRRVTNRDSLDPWIAAQKVQVSAFADGSNYRAKWPRAQDLWKHSQFGGNAPPPPPPSQGGGSSGERARPAYDNANHRNVITEDDHDPDISWRHHQDRGSLGGVDHIAPSGTPVYANCAGRVRLISLEAGGTGGKTINLHLGSTGWYDQYMHLSVFKVRDGQHVDQGQLIGYSGGSGKGSMTGWAPHLHIHRYAPNGDRLNPYHYFGDTGIHDSRNHKPSGLFVTPYTGVPNANFYRRLQWFGKEFGGSYSFDYGCDGFMSIPAWKGVQYALRSYQYKGAIDGVPGASTYKALQLMAHDHGSKSPIDGTLSTDDYRGIAKRLNLL